MLYFLQTAFFTVSHEISISLLEKISVRCSLANFAVIG